MGIVVFAEGHIDKTVFGIDKGKAVELVLPDDVVCFLEGGLRGSNDELFARGHEIDDLGVQRHAGQTVVALSHHTEQLTVGLAVVGNGHGGVARCLLELEHLIERHIRRKGCIAYDESRLVLLYARDHGSLVFDGLVAVDEGQTALGCKRHGHAIVGDGGIPPRLCGNEPTAFSG